MNEQYIAKRIREYTAQKSDYEKLAKSILEILRFLIQEEHPSIKVASYSHRVKDSESLKKKLQKDKYNEDSEITDLAGVRVITYSGKDIEPIEKIIKRSFYVDEVNSVNKTSILGNNRVGYRGRHYVVSFDADRQKMPENKRFIGLKCEIQLTSLIAHTWSEITHERGYKFEGELPIELERRKNLLAGMLELADMEMDAYVQSYDEYVEKIQQEVKEGGLDMEMNSMSLEKYMAWKFPYISPQIFRDVDLILKELKDFGISSIKTLNGLVDPKFEEEIKNAEWRSLDGIIRNILILSDAEKYFSQVWNPSMTQMNKKNYELYKRYEIDIDQISKKMA
ncbi:MAG: RelA/SpoT domain-containing protein [bacterium]|nr:RelA/SpoT domain-containing protein [bacterium]